MRRRSGITALGHAVSLWLAVACTLLSPSFVFGVLHVLDDVDVEVPVLALCATGCHDPGHSHGHRHGHDCSQCGAHRVHFPLLVPDRVDLRGVPPLPIDLSRASTPRGAVHPSSSRPRAPPAAV